MGKNVEEKGVKVRYAWNGDIQNWCLVKGGTKRKPIFVEPLQEIEDSMLDEVFLSGITKNIGRVKGS